MKTTIDPIVWNCAKDNDLMIKFIDLFCGTGGFRIGVEMICHQYNIYSQCVFSSDIDIDSQKIYTANFGETPAGDITKINEKARRCGHSAII